MNEIHAAEARTSSINAVHSSFHRRKRNWTHLMNGVNATTLNSIIQFHFNLRIELKWIDFVGTVHSALTFIQFHSPFNFNALNGCEMKKESGSIPLRFGLFAFTARHFLDFINSCFLAVSFSFHLRAASFGTLLFGHLICLFAPCISFNSVKWNEITRCALLSASFSHSAFMLRCSFRYTHSPSLTSFRHFQLLQSVNFGTFRYLIPLIS